MRDSRVFRQIRSPAAYKYIQIRHRFERLLFSSYEKDFEKSTLIKPFSSFPGLSFTNIEFYIRVGWSTTIRKVKKQTEHHTPRLPQCTRILLTTVSTNLVYFGHSDR